MSTLDELVEEPRQRVGLKERQLHAYGPQDRSSPGVPFGEKDHQCQDRQHEDEPEDRSYQVDGMEAVHRQRGEQCHPEDGVEHHRRAEPLARKSYPGVGPRDARTGQEPVAERVADEVPAGQAVADGERGELYARNGCEARVRRLGQERARQPEVGQERQDLEEKTCQRQEGVYARQDVERLMGAADLRHDHVLEHEAGNQELR